MYIYIYLLLYIHICMCVYIHILICMYVHICVSLKVPEEELSRLVILPKSTYYFAIGSKYGPLFGPLPVSTHFGWSSRYGLSFGMGSIVGRQRFQTGGP